LLTTFHLVFLQDWSTEEQAIHLKYLLLGNDWSTSAEQKAKLLLLLYAPVDRLMENQHCWPIIWNFTRNPVKYDYIFSPLATAILVLDTQLSLEVFNEIIRK
jgi:hypothetical protein